MTILKLTGNKGTSNTYPVYVKPENICCIYKESGYNNTTVTLTNGGYLSVKESPDEILYLIEADINEVGGAE